MSTTVADELARLKAENERLAKALAAKTMSRVGFKVSTKGAVSAYGLQRFPVTLYGSQWVALAARMPDLLKFVKDHEAELAVREE